MPPRDYDDEGEDPAPEQVCLRIIHHDTRLLLLLLLPPPTNHWPVSMCRQLLALLEEVDGAWLQIKEVRAVNEPTQRLVCL